MGFDERKESLYHLKNLLSKTEALIERSDKMSEANKKTLKRFKEHIILRGLSIHRVVMYLRMGRLIAEMGQKDYNSFSREDVDKVMVCLHEEGYANATINLTRLTFKTLFRWLEGLKDDENSERVKHLKELKTKTKLTRQDLVMDDDANKLIAGASALKNGLLFSTMIAVQLDTFCRPGELRNIRLNEISKTHYGFSITVDGKTGQRRVYCVTSAPLLERWLNAHADKNNPEAPLFYLQKKGEIKPVEHGAYIVCIDRLSRKILGRHVSAYCLRHSAITRGIANGLSERMVQKIAGHVPGSEHTGHYVHLVDTDAESAILKMNGVSIAEEHKQSPLVKRICGKCNTEAASFETICAKCGGIIDRTTSVIQEEERNKFSFNALTDEAKAFYKTTFAEMKAEMMREIKKDMTVGGG